MVCAHDLWVSPPRKQENFIRARFGPVWGFDPFRGKNYTVSKLWNLLFVWFEIWQVFLWLWYLKGRVLLIQNFAPKWACDNGAILGPKKCGLNGAIINRSASNLVCTHYYLVYPPGKLKNSIWDRFGQLLGLQTHFGAPKLRGLITMESDVHDVCNLAGMCGILMFKMWQCENFQFLSLSGPMEMGLFWVPKCAVSHKWWNFQPFCFKFGLCIWFLDISTGKTREAYLGPFWAPKLWGLTTMETVLQKIWNLAGFCCIMMSKIWQCANFQILFLTWPMGMGQFWVPKLRGRS